MFVYMSRAMKNKLMVFISISYLWCISTLYFIRCCLVSANTKTNSISIFHNIQNKMVPLYHLKFKEKCNEQTSNENLIGCTTASHSASFCHLMNIRVAFMLSQNQTKLVKALRRTRFEVIQRNLHGCQIRLSFA